MLYYVILLKRMGMFYQKTHISAVTHPRTLNWEGGWLLCCCCGCFAVVVLRMCCCCGCSVALHRGAVDWSAMCG